MDKTSKGLVEHCKMALSQKWGYVWGTYGQKLTKSLLNKQLKQYPNEVGKYKDFIEQNWINKRVADCAGLIKSYLWWNNGKIKYNSKQSMSSASMFNTAKEKGPISEIPETPGICVWKKGHVGVYIGKGQVIEAKGTKYGVVQTSLKGSGSTKWTHWFKCPFIKYSDVIKDLGIFEITAYDLSVQSCGKPIGHPGYGVTASGFNLSGHTWESARAIAVDPKKIKLGSKVRLTFTEPGYQKYNGVYTARDTGGAIKNKIIDFFMGDFKNNKPHQSVWNFGRTKAKVELVTGDAANIGFDGIYDEDDIVISSTVDSSEAVVELENSPLTGEPIYPDLLNIDEYKKFKLLNIDIGKYAKQEENMTYAIDKDKLEKKIGIKLEDIFPLSEKQKNFSYDKKKLNSIKKKPNPNGPENANDPFPIDSKIEMLEVHDPKVMIDRIIVDDSINGMARLSEHIVNLSLRTERRLVSIENNMATIMRYLFALSGRININCVYYGGQCTFEKYKCIRCLNDDRISDGAYVSLDQCLNCKRYEPILGQVYDVLEDGNADFNAILDDLQMGYATIDEYLELASNQDMINEKKQADMTKAKAKKADFIKDKWSKLDYKMDWKLAAIEGREVDINWADSESSEYEGPTKTIFNRNFPVYDEDSSSMGSYGSIEEYASLDGNINPNFARPLKKYRISSDFGWRVHPISGKRKFHNGIDLAIGTGTPIYSSTDGKVISAGSAGSAGNMTTIQSGSYIVKYMHQSKIDVKVGQEIKQGQYIGKVGTTGGSTGPHLHFEIRKNNTPINPKKLVKL